MSKPKSNMVEEIKRVIVQRDWEERNRILLLLLKKIEHQKVMELAMEYAEWYLPRFMERNPSEIWVEARLGEIRKAMVVGFDNTSSPEVLPELSNTIKNVSGRTFQRGTIYNLWAMVKSAENQDQSIEFAQKAISTTLTIVRNEYRDWIPPEFSKNGELISFDELEFSIWAKLIERIEGLIEDSNQNL